MPRKNNLSGVFEDAKRDMAQAIVTTAVPAVGVRIEMRVRSLDQLAWLAAQDTPVKIYGANQDDSMAIAGVGAAASYFGSGTIDYKKIFQRLRAGLRPQYPYMQWYGGIAFDPGAKDERWNKFGSWHFVLPLFELARDGDRMIFCCNLMPDSSKSDVLSVLQKLNAPCLQGEDADKPIRRQDSPNLKEWNQSVEEVLRGIKRGNYEKIVLARRTDFSFSQPLNPWLMLKNLNKVTANSYHFAFEFNKGIFLGASPERLYKRRGRRIQSEALAGTKPVSVAPALLLRSPKDRHEHQVVVRDIASALKKFCQELRHDPEPAIRTLSNGHHLNTSFEGTLKEQVRDEDILSALHPTSAVGGKPKEAAQQFLRRHEPFGRGWYAGPLGYVGLDWAEFVVGIRSGLIQGKRLSVFAGAGIVEGSVAADEWQEIENKISNFIKIIK